MIRFLLFLTVLFLGACKPSSTTTSISIPVSPATTSKSLKSLNAPLHKPTCKIPGKVLNHNQLWLRDQSLIACISSDTTTKDLQLGDSHRILSLYNTTNCEQALRLVLPINRSPDFPYHLADINYNKNSNIIAIKGIDHFYCLNLDNKKLLPPLRPIFKTPRLAVDAQSNQIQRLEIWENFIIGYAQDQGVFVFQLNSSSTPFAVLPHVEYKVNETLYHSLFLIASGDKMQAIIPTYNWEEDRFEINPIFKQPILLQKEVLSKKQNKEYLILRSASDNQAIVIDLKNRKKLELPVDIQQKQSKDIEVYLEKRAAVKK